MYLFEFQLIVVFSRLDYDDSGEFDSSEELEFQDFSEGKLHFDHVAPTMLKLFNSVFKIIIACIFLVNYFNALFKCLIIPIIIVWPTLNIEMSFLCHHR